MIKRALDGPIGTGSRGPSGSLLGGPLCLKDLLTSGDADPHLADKLHAVLQVARLVIGGNLDRRALDGGTLRRLRTSILNQRNDARSLRMKLAAGRAPEGVLEALVELDEFFGDAASKTESQIGPGH